MKKWVKTAFMRSVWLNCEVSRTTLTAWGNIPILAELAGHRMEIANIADENAIRSEYNKLRAFWCSWTKIASNASANSLVDLQIPTSCSLRIFSGNLWSGKYALYHEFNEDWGILRNFNQAARPEAAACYECQDVDAKFDHEFNCIVA